MTKPPLQEVAMSRTSLLLLTALLLSPLANAKDKKNKPQLTADVLRAQTVLVMISPDAGESLEDPAGNRRAQEDVERALMKWGRFRLATDVSTADLIVTVRKGHGRMVNPTIANSPIDNRPVIYQPGDENTRIGAQQGRPPGMNQPGINQPGMPQDTEPRAQTEIGSSEDIFEVYRGGVDYPLERAAVWRYSAKDALRPTSLSAVEQFHKAIEQSEKALAAQDAQKQDAQKKKP
jgi:hypothetical protein